MDRQLKTRWPMLLNGIAWQHNPHAEIFRPLDAEALVSVAIEIVNALDAAHATGIVD